MKKYGQQVSIQEFDNLFEEMGNKITVLEEKNSILSKIISLMKEKADCMAKVHMYKDDVAFVRWGNINSEIDVLENKLLKISEVQE